jgi:sulfofructosephosphate aldolase
MTTTDRPTLDRIARPTGTMAMVAMDQRESLRTMFADAGVTGAGDDTLVAFKRDVARELTPLASAFLVDRDFGLREIVDDGLVAPGCAVIAAADALQQEPGQIVEDTLLDEVVASPEFSYHGIDAIKLLVIWRRDERRADRVELARRFVEVARARGVLSVLEPVVRATPAELEAGTWDTEVAIREAARELSATGPDLYKVQVPLGGRAPHDELVALCRLLDEAIATPWVVLSQGVALDAFPAAVRAACEAGASGFLAGRALWSDVVGEADVADALRRVSVPRLAALGEIVDAHGRPWREAAAAKGVL